MSKRIAGVLLTIAILVPAGQADAADRPPADPSRGPDRRYEVLIDGRLAWVEPAASHRPGVIEAEGLVSRAIARESPRPARQAMHRFAGAWDGAAQLFWPAAAPRQLAGAVYASLELPIELADPGRYDVTLNYTVAPDYGTYNVILGGELRARIDGYAAAVGRASLQLRDVRLRAGDNQLVLAVTGRNHAASNYFVGLDSIELGRHGAPATPGPAPELAAAVQVGGQAASWDADLVHGAGQGTPIGADACLVLVDFSIGNPADTASRPAVVVARIDAPLPPGAEQPIQDAGWRTDGTPPGGHWRGTLALDPLAAGQTRIRSLPVPLRAQRTTGLRLSVLDGASAGELRLRPPPGCAGK